MFKTLYGKLVAVLVCFALIMAGMFLVVTRHLDMKRSQELHQKLYRTLAAQLVHDHILLDSENLDSLRIQQVFDKLRLINPRIDVYLLDGSGKIVASSVRTRIVRDQVSVEPLRKFLDTSAELPILGDDPTEVSRQRVFSAAPIAIRRNADGYLYLIMRGLTSDSIAERIKSSHSLRESLWFIAWGLVFALIAGMLVMRFMTRPLRQLTSVMDKFQQGGFVSAQPANVPAGSSLLRDEIGHITETFHAMADRILEQMRTLRQTDATRRELVANISHDLRTPLASLQGYLETLHLKRNQLSAEEQRNYVEIALRQSAQLSHLVGELFDLARLDSGQTRVNAEPFMLEDLVQDVIQQFELEASRKKIRLQTRVPDELPLVVADIGLIERVLRNLIDNALRHTPADGTIAVTLTPGTGQVTVEVSDNGSGITAQDLPHIFDRFYRGEKSRSDCGLNAGLGLAIAKRILELHGTTIRADSKPGMTTITFALPCAERITPAADGAPHTTEQTGEEDYRSCAAALPPHATVNEDLMTWARRELAATPESEAGSTEPITARRTGT